MQTNLIIREKYLERINRFRDQSIIKVITGQRRAGKSFILKTFMEDLQKKQIKPENILYINKEDLAFDFIKTYQELAKYVEEKSKKANKKQKIYLIIDEVQEIFEFEKALRSFLLNEQYDLYISGSNSEIVSSELASFLSGRFIEIYVTTLDYAEFLLFANLSDNIESLEKYLKYGGLPFIHRFTLNDELVFTYAKNIYNTILLKDVIQKYEIRNVQFLEKLIYFLCNNIGSIFSANAISKYLKSEGLAISPNLVLDYLKSLSASYFIHETNRYDLLGKKIFKLNSKFYLNDLGIRNSLIGFSETNLHQLMENIVYLHLLGNEYRVFVGVLGDKEIDFVAIKNNQTIYIQVALTAQNKQTQEREFGNLLKIQDNFEKIVVTMDPITLDYKGIKHFKLSDFLLNFK